MVAALSLFIQKCMESGMIFRRYYLYLIHIYVQNWRKKDRYKRFLLKPIGLCIYCYSTWIAIFTYVIKFGFSYDILLFIGMNYLFIQLYFRYIKS